MPILSPLLGTDCGICTAYDEQYIVCSMNVKFDTDAIGKAWNGVYVHRYMFYFARFIVHQER
jgi:hypothetical protein